MSYRESVHVVEATEQVSTGEPLADILEQLILRSGAWAERVLPVCYKTSSLSYIQSILQRALSVLSCENHRAVIAHEVARLGAGAQLALLADIRSASIELDAPHGNPDPARSVLIELAATVERSGTIAHALSRLELVLSLGQTDEHQLMSHAHEPLWTLESV